MYGAALYRLRKEDFGELQHHDGISPAWPISYDELEPYYTLAEQLYHVHGARGEDPTEPPSSAPYPHPAVSHEPRIQQLADDLAAAGYRPFHAPCGIMLDESNPPFIDLHPLCDLRRLPVPRAREVRRRGAGCSTRARAFERHAADEREGRQARHERRGHGRHRGRRRSGGRGGAILGGCRRGRLRGGQHGQAAPGVGEREAPERARERLRSGRPQLHVPRLDGGPRALARGEPDRVPEDARAQRLLLRLGRLRVPARETCRWWASRRLRCSAASGRGRRKLAPEWTLERMARHAIDFWLSTEDLPRPDNRVTVDGDGNIVLTYAETNLEAKKRLYEKVKSMLGELDMNPGPPHPSLRVHEERHPDRRLRAPGGHRSVRHRPERRRCST